MLYKLMTKNRLTINSVDPARVNAAPKKSTTTIFLEAVRNHFMREDKGHTFSSAPQLS